MHILLFILAAYIPIDSWHNEMLEELQVRGEHFTCFPSIRPFEKRNIIFLNESYNANKLILHNISTYFCVGDTVEVLRVEPSVRYDWSEFSIFVQPVVKFGKDSLPPYEVFMDLFAADYERAYVKYDNSNFDIFVGRERFAIGPSPRYNLLVSGYSAPMDWLHFSLKTRKIKLSYFLSRLDDLNCKPLEYAGDTITEYINARRYLSIKRLDYSPVNWINLGLTEGAIFGGSNYSLEMYHLNPVIFLQAYQYNWGKDVNFFLSLDGKVFLRNSALYAALLIDDFQLETDPNNEPNHLGVNIGVEFADPFGLNNTFWIFEYSAVSRFTYCHFIPYQRFQYIGLPIGSPFGPDYDEVYAKCVCHMRPAIDVFSQISHMRKGETSINTLWPIPEIPREPDTSFPENNFLSGVIEQTTTFSLGFRFFYRTWLVSELTIGLQYRNNFQHETGVDKRSVVIQLHVDMIKL